MHPSWPTGPAAGHSCSLSEPGRERCRPLIAGRARCCSSVGDSAASARHCLARTGGSRASVVQLRTQTLTTRTSVVCYLYMQKESPQKLQTAAHTVPVRTKSREPHVFDHPSARERGDLINATGPLAPRRDSHLVAQQDLSPHRPGTPCHRSSQSAARLPRPVHATHWLHPPCSCACSLVHCTGPRSATPLSMGIILAAT